ncbi:embryonic polarity protein dorsal-like isoform X1 [Osmia bicornis bicornis]|uniref:embryonic polarity protein dorsal-like isoform X1 n=2 Tax=Osmia bicornis bicornis TaxID=1437191 RepID=UPI0010F93F77|nr:embryonic polarity protein dorsal-like isoform X1 [Osmia bicornis bicornis]XP_029047825.1 embryonic polarity protein dorsal-like isoform X1 [Osmia bicornis bicornis]XP_029047834.1 embryonic polarity protein dorsal-like isoform X1 [Osmia bicornis bicornis]XP_029047845.1 embryonic polarity protein dorsal-like isoform X1 [Osmia bicornis bicornis]XP_046140951.1 embryonic polarity protein dorsal-like isoform X1 [Osmia bicornis bicornis]
MEQFHGMSDGNINISDVIEVIQTDPKFVEASGREEQLPVEMNIGRPLQYVEIIEQPASKALRFRYECEGRSAGSIPGVNSTPENKTFPSIRIVGYKGRAVVVVSCVTKDQPYRPHPHNLVGKEACKRGVCTVEVSSENMTVTFANLGIQCVKKKDIEEALRIREEIRVDPFRTGFEHKRQPTSIDLNAVRLCFQVFLEGSQKGKFNIQLPPVVSDPIFDKKAMSDLVICKLSHCSASVAGGMEMILLCEKVAKEDIQVRFFEEKDGQVVWEGFGDFQPTHVHKQTAIAFRTPTYRIQQVDQPVQVYIQLKRPSDGATSEPLPFQMLPLGAGRPAFWSLRKAFARKKTDYSTFGKILATESALLSNVTPKLARNIDEFNNNDFSIKKSNNKISALRALNDLYNVKNTLDSCNGSTEVAQNNAQNMDHTKSTIIDYENNEVPFHTEKTMENEQMNKIYKIDSNYMNKDMDNTNSGTLTRTKSDSTDNDILRNSEMSKNKSDWFDYSEVGKWVQKGQMCLKEKDNEADFKTEMTDDCNKSFNELLTQVAELDQIYADTHTKLVQAALEQNTTDQSMDIDVCDNQTYTSLQMAMKNPIEFVDVTNDRKYEDVCVPKPDPNQSCPSPPVTAKRDGTQETEERLPPLPPKRIRKMPSMPLLPRPISSPMTTDSYIEAPNKTLPSLPGTLTKTSKQGLFSKLFAKKIKSDKDTISNASKESNTSLNIPGKVSYLMKNNIPDGTQLQSPRLNATSNTSIKSLRLEGDVTPPYGMELTEAEHYALYTAMAPHATASEFDEMSFYYSPVEGGKIFSDKKET